MDEGDQHGKDEPGLNPLDIGGLGQLLDDTDQEGGGGQHQSDVHSDGRVEEVWQLEEGSGIADCDEQKGGKECHQSFIGQTSFENNIETNFLVVFLRKCWGFWIISDVIFGQFLVTFNVGFSKYQTYTFKI